MPGWEVQPVQQASVPRLGWVGARVDPLVCAPCPVLGAQRGSAVARSDEGNRGCTAAPLPRAAGLVHDVPSSPHAASQHGWGKVCSPPNAGFNVPRFGSGNCPSLVAESARLIRLFPLSKLMPMGIAQGWGRQSSPRSGPQQPVYCRQSRGSCTAEVEQPPEPGGPCAGSVLVCIVTLQRNMQETTVDRYRITSHQKFLAAPSNWRCHQSLHAFQNLDCCFSVLLGRSRYLCDYSFLSSAPICF